MASKHILRLIGYTFQVDTKNCMKYVESCKRHKILDTVDIC